MPVCELLETEKENGKSAEVQAEAVSGIPCKPDYLTPAELDALRLAGAKIGAFASISRDVMIDYPEKLVLGDGVRIGPQAILMTAGGVKVGDRTIIGPGVQLISSVPKIPLGQKRFSEVEKRNVEICIGNDVYIASGAILMPGVIIGMGTLIGPGAVIKSMVDVYKVVTTVPPYQSRNRNSVYFF